tara:strand:- start:1937 stop:2188 length:252 start_codon:yes stop_codon:yes gene_type:complete
MKTLILSIFLLGCATPNYYALKINHCDNNSLTYFDDYESTGHYNDVEEYSFLDSESLYYSPDNCTSILKTKRSDIRESVAESI